jgi:Protein of unknown function (DUF2505)
MELKGSAVYPVPLDAVLALLRDQDATVAKYESMGHRDVEVREFAADDETMRVVTSRVVDVDVPGFAKKVLKPTNTMTQTDNWQRADDGTWSGTFDVEVKGAPARISGTMRLAPDPGGTRHDVVIDLQVKVPLIGGKIADWMGKADVKKTLDAEFAFNASRLGGTEPA